MIRIKIGITILIVFRIVIDVLLYDDNPFVGTTRQRRDDPLSERSERGAQYGAHLSPGKGA
jgi:hypothetical protein